MLEIVRAFNWIIQAGKAFYWATSEWSPEQIEEAHRRSPSNLCYSCDETKLDVTF